MLEELEIGDLLLLAAALYGAMSVASLLLYRRDKRAAERGRRRIPERVLLGVDLLGGWPGGWAAMHLFRHKRRKRSYTTLHLSVVILHLTAWGFLLAELLPYG